MSQHKRHSPQLINLFLLALFLTSFTVTVHAGKKGCCGCPPFSCKKKEKKNNCQGNANNHPDGDDIHEPLLSNTVYPANNAGVATEIINGAQAIPSTSSCAVAPSTGHPPTSLSYAPQKDEPKSTSYFSLTFLVSTNYDPCEVMARKSPRNYLEMKSIFQGMDYPLYPYQQTNDAKIPQVTERNTHGDYNTVEVSTLFDSVGSIDYNFILNSDFFPKSTLTVNVGDASTVLSDKSKEFKSLLQDYKPSLLWQQHNPINPVCLPLQKKLLTESGRRIYVAVHNFPVKLPNLVSMGLVCDPKVTVLEFDNWRLRMSRKAEVADSSTSTSPSHRDQNYIIPTSRITRVRGDQIWYLRSPLSTLNNMYGEMLELPIKNINGFHTMVENVMKSAILQNELWPDSGMVANTFGRIWPYLGDVCPGPWQEIGSGSYGNVYLAKCELDWEYETMAIKTQGSKNTYQIDFNSQYKAELKERATLQNEANILRYLTFRNYEGILKHKQFYSYSAIHQSSTCKRADLYLYILMEMAGGTLRELIDASRTVSAANPERLSVDAIKSILEQIFTGIRNLHSAGIVHRDLKPANILYFSENDNFRMAIADFGLSKIVAAADSEQTALDTPDAEIQESLSHKGTPGYRPPSSVYQHFSFAVDYFAFGAIILNFCFRRYTYPLHAIVSPKENWMDILYNGCKQYIMFVVQQRRQPPLSSEEKKEIPTLRRHLYDSFKESKTVLIYKILKLGKAIDIQQRAKQVETILFEDEQKARAFFETDIFETSSPLPEDAATRERETLRNVINVLQFIKVGPPPEGQAKSYTGIFDRDVFRAVVTKIFHNQPLYELLMECLGVSDGYKIDMKKVESLLPRIYEGDQAF